MEGGCAVAGGVCLKDLAQPRTTILSHGALEAVSGMGREPLQLLCDGNAVCDSHRPFSAEGLAKKEAAGWESPAACQEYFHYDYNIVYRPGKENLVADLLSRSLFYVSPVIVATIVW